MKSKQPKPLKIPECPWPKEVWQMTENDYAEAVPNRGLRTAVSGFLMRQGWELAIKQIKELNE